MDRSVTVVIYVDRRQNFTSSTASPDTLQTLESAFRAGSWWRDRWGNRSFRAAAREVLRETGGLVLIGPSMPFEMPAPFAEFFEPIELVGGLGTNRERLEVLSGDSPTRQERLWWIGITIVVVGALALLSGLIIGGALHGHRHVLPVVLVGTAALAGLVYLLLSALQRRVGRWFLVPGGIAIVRRPPRRGLPARITVLARADTCLVLRYVSTGKTTVLMLELWAHGGQQFRRTMTEREAMSVLAAWQSALAPPADELLQEVVTW